MKLFSPKYIKITIVYFAILLLLRIDLDTKSMPSEDIIKSAIASVVFVLVIYFFDRKKISTEDN